MQPTELGPALDLIRQLRHDYRICHNDAVVNAASLSECEQKIEAVRHVLQAHGPAGRDSAGYDLWRDVMDAIE